MTWVFVAIAVAFLLIIIGRVQDYRARPKRMPKPTPSRQISTPTPARHVPPKPVSMAGIERLVNANQIIQAIKEYRAAHGVSLKDAKEAIDAIRDRQRRPIQNSGHSNKSTVRNVETAIEVLLERNEIIPAIKLYREPYGVSLKEAKDAIEQMRSRM